MAQTVKNLSVSRRPGFYPWVRKISGRREWLPTPVFLPGEFHGQRSPVGYHLWSCRVRHDWGNFTRIPSFGKLQTGRFKETVLWTCELETNCSCLLNAWIIHMNVHSIPCSLIWPTGVNLLMGLHHPDSNHYCWDPQKFIQQRNFLQFKSWMYHRFLCTLKNSHWRKNNISTIFLLVTYESNYL